jgi:hypothetical protein
MYSDPKYSKVSMTTVYRFIEKRCESFKDYKQYVEHIRKVLNAHVRVTDTEDEMQNIMGWKNLLNELTKDFTSREETFRFMRFFIIQFLRVRQAYQYWHFMDVDFNMCGDNRKTYILMIYMIELYYTMKDLQSFTSNCKSYYESEKRQIFYKNVNPSFLKREMITPSLDSVMKNTEIFLESTFHFDNKYTWDILTVDILKLQKMCVVSSNQTNWLSDILINLFSDIYSLSYMRFCDFPFIKRDDNVIKILEQIFTKMMKSVSNIDEWESIIGDELLSHRFLPHPFHFLQKNVKDTDPDSWLSKARFQYLYNDDIPNSDKKFDWKQNNIFHKWELTQIPQSSYEQKKEEEDAKPETGGVRYSCLSRSTIKIKKKKPLYKITKENRSRTKRSYLRPYLYKIAC